MPGEVSGGDLKLVEDAAQRLTVERDAFRADQFHRAGAWLAHYQTTGPEIWEQSGGMLDALADVAGTGGTYAGVTKALKEPNAAIRCYLVEPAGAAVLKGDAVTRASHPIQGGGYAMDLDFLKGVPVDGYLTVTGEEARQTARALAKTAASAHMEAVDRRTDDLAAPRTYGRPAAVPENPMRIRRSALCAKQQAGAHICNQEVKGFS